MKKFYTVFLSLLIVLHLVSFAGPNKASAVSGTIVIRLDQSKYRSININQLYVVFDKFDRTGAGIVKEKVPLTNNEAVINDVPEGKYYVDVYTGGAYSQ